MFFRDGRDNRVIEHALPSLDERTVRLYDDAIVVTIIYDLSLLTERVKLTKVKSLDMSREWVAWKFNRRSYLDLVHGRGLEPRLGDFLEVANTTTHNFRPTFPLW